MKVLSHTLQTLVLLVSWPFVTLYAMAKMLATSALYTAIAILNVWSGK